ncbi:threonylcarbamoyl-AMP synthase [Candidatus Woesearchaeota archaeon]|nr:threonylcarbamoyl-AMP synthase [Candidatus Woesearchaeota archaeon]
MEILTKEEVFLRDAELGERIRKGALFIYPTDTIYGIGCSALHEAAVKKVRAAKLRYDRPFSIIPPTKDWIVEHCSITTKRKSWLAKLPGPYTLILPLKDTEAIAPSVNNGLNTLGIRIPKHWITSFVTKLGIPIITTSANQSGGNFMTSLDDLHPKIKAKMDFIIYEEELQGKPSTVVDLSTPTVEMRTR